MDKNCSICNESPVVARGWCSRHYQRYKKYGNPITTAFKRTRQKVGSPEYFEECTDKASGPLDTDCWLWNKAIDEAGYGRFGKTSLYAHRESYGLFVGTVPEGMIICHECDVRACVNPKHLFIGTYQDNNDDMIEKGRDRKFRILSDEDVSEIRLRLAGGEQQKSIATDFNISRSMVSAINTKRRRR
jgi:hypothetical protein